MKKDALLLQLTICTLVFALLMGCAIGGEGDCERKELEGSFEPPEGNEPIVERLLGSSPVPAGRYKYMVGLRAPTGATLKFYCGGVLIAARWVLTAASCVDGLSMAQSITRPTVTGGTDLRREANDDFPEISRNVEAFMHPEWLETKGDPRNGFDIALLKLPCDSRLKPVKLPKQGQKLTPGKTLFAIGWGRSSGFSGFNEFLQRARLPETDREICAKILGPVADTIVCAGDGLGDVCEGDAGSPLIEQEGGAEDDVVVGVVTASAGKCGLTQKPAIFTSVAAVRDWIDRTIEENTDKEPVEPVEPPEVEKPVKPVKPVESVKPVKGPEVEEPKSRGPTTPRVKPKSSAKNKKNKKKKKKKKKSDKDDKEDLVTGKIIVKALVKGKESQTEAVKKIAVAIIQERPEAVQSAAEHAKSRGLLQEMGTALIEAVKLGVPEEDVQDAIDFVSENL